MNDADKWFTYIRQDIELAENNFEAGNAAAVHYFLGRLVGDVRVIREMMESNQREPAESSESKKEL